MAALTKRFQISRSIVGGIVIDVRCRQDDMSSTKLVLKLPKIDPIDRPARLSRPRRQD